MGTTGALVKRVASGAESGRAPYETTPCVGRKAMRARAAARPEAKNPMRPFLVVALAVTLALPLAAASHGGKLPHLDANEVNVGPCYLGWSLYWPGDYLWAGCVVAGKDVGVVCTTGALDNGCHLRPLLP